MQWIILRGEITNVFIAKAENAFAICKQIAKNL